MHLKNDEITLLYNANNPRDRQTLAYAATISSKINRQEINSVTISATLFEMMVNGLGIEPKQLLNKADPEYQRFHRGSQYNSKMWIEAIKRRPELLRAPVAMYRNRVVICDTPTAVLRLAIPQTVSA